MYYRELFPKIERLSKSLKATDPRFRRTVRIIHEEGTVMFFEHAFACVLHDSPRNWICIFTEHHGFLMYDEDEITYRQYEWVIPNSEDVITMKELEELDE